MVRLEVSNRTAFEHLGNLAGQASGLFHQKCLQRPQTVDGAQTAASQHTQTDISVRKQRVDRDPRCRGGCAVEPAPALVAPEHAQAADVETEPAGIDQRFRQSGDVFQPMIETLACDPMQAMRGVACQNEPRGHEIAGERHGQGISLGFR